MELKDLQNKIISGEFIIGHKVKVKSLNEIRDIEVAEDVYYKGELDELADKVFASSKLECYKKCGSMEVYVSKPNWPYNTKTIDLTYLDFVEDSSKPTDEAYDLCKELIDMNIHIFMSTCGEMHGSSKSAFIDNTNCYPILDKDGISEIHMPISGYSNDALSLDIIRELLNKKNSDQSINTGASYIARDLHLYTEEEVNKKSFSY
jgi:hypothetical protein